MFGIILPFWLILVDIVLVIAVWWLVLINQKLEAIFVSILAILFNCLILSYSITPILPWIIANWGFVLILSIVYLGLGITWTYIGWILYINLPETKQLILERYHRWDLYKDSKSFDESNQYPFVFKEECNIAVFSIFLWPIHMCLILSYYTVVWCTKLLKNFYKSVTRSYVQKIINNHK